MDQWAWKSELTDRPLSVEVSHKFEQHLRKFVIVKKKIYWRWSILALFNWLGLIKLLGTLFIFVYRYLKFKIVYFDINAILL
jgi:hypothetical protein